jgi:hypothetical protein
MEGGSTITVPMMLTCSEATNVSFAANHRLFFEQIKPMTY